MTIAQLLPMFISTSIMLTVFGLGVNSDVEDSIFLFRNPGLFFRSILSMNIILVGVAVAIVSMLNLSPAIKIAIVALAMSPVPPVLPRKQHKVGSTGSYAMGLVVTAALCSIVIVPTWLELLGRHFQFDVHLGLRKILSIVIESILTPLFAGILMRRLAPKFAKRLGKPLSILAAVLLAAGVLPILFTARHALWAMLGSGVVLVLAIFSLIGLAVGHLLGGPDPDNRSVLAMATSARHPGIALAIASLNFPAQKSAVMIVVLYHLIVGAIVVIPYAKWRSRLHTEPAMGDQQ